MTNAFFHGNNHWWSVTNFLSITELITDCSTLFTWIITKLYLALFHWDSPSPTDPVMFPSEFFTWLISDLHFDCDYAYFAQCFMKVINKVYSFTDIVWRVGA